MLHSLMTSVRIFFDLMPFLAVIFFTMFLLEVWRQQDVNAPLKIRILGFGKSLLRMFSLKGGRLYRAMVVAGLAMTFALSAVHISGATGLRTDRGVVSTKFVTTVGVNAIRDGFLGTFTLSNFKYHASGTGTTAENVADTALVTEVESRVAGTQVSGGTGAYQTVATIPYTATRTITEHGIFSASTVGSLLDRSMFSGSSIGVVNGDSIQFTYTITFSAGG